MRHLTTLLGLAFAIAFPLSAYADNPQTSAGTTVGSSVHPMADTTQSGSSQTNTPRATQHATGTHPAHMATTANTAGDMRARQLHQLSKSDRSHVVL